MLDKKNIKHKKHKKERGQELVEFALIFPVLLMIVVGIFDLGRAFYSIIVITNAAREGARYAINHPDELSDSPSWGTAKNVTIQDANSSGINLTTGNVSISCTDSGGDGWCDSAKPVVVSVSYNFQYLFGLFLPGPSLNFIRQVEMMVP